MNQKLYKAKHHFIATEEETNFRIIGPFGLNLLLLKLKTKNWKYYNKIIFKCVNSTVRLIFNIF